jgi:hypothetical protein
LLAASVRGGAESVDSENADKPSAPPSYDRPLKSVAQLRDGSLKIHLYAFVDCVNFDVKNEIVVEDWIGRHARKACPTGFDLISAGPVHGGHMADSDGCCAYADAVIRCSAEQAPN